MEKYSRNILGRQIRYFRKIANIFTFCALPVFWQNPSITSCTVTVAPVLSHNLPLVSPWPMVTRANKSVLVYSELPNSSRRPSRVSFSTSFLISIWKRCNIGSNKTKTCQIALIEYNISYTSRLILVGWGAVAPLWPLREQTALNFLLSNSYVAWFFLPKTCVLQFLLIEWSWGGPRFKFKFKLKIILPLCCSHKHSLGQVVMIENQPIGTLQWCVCLLL